MDFGYVQMSVTIQEETAPLFNYLFKVLAPVVYIILLAVLFQKIKADYLNDKIYLVVIYYWAYRFLFITVRGRLLLLNWGLQIIYWVSSILLALWVNSIIESVNTILPDSKTLLDELWILVILFLYTIFNKIEYSREGADKRVKRYTYKKYELFKERFEPIISSHTNLDWLKAAVYSIMVYEDFNRPGIARVLERAIFCKSRKKHSFGIMQVSSNYSLSDEESIVLAIGIIKQGVNDYLKKEYVISDDSVYVYSVVSHVFSLYNPGDPNYASEVCFVYKNITEKYYPDLLSYEQKGNIKL